jgi:hypothetical protein
MTFPLLVVFSWSTARERSATQSITRAFGIAVLADPFAGGFVDDLLQPQMIERLDAIPPSTVKMVPVV